jgi:hypothetical protein
MQGGKRQRTKGRTNAPFLALAMMTTTAEIVLSSA